MAIAGLGDAATRFLAPAGVFTWPIFVTFLAFSDPDPRGTRMDTEVRLKSGLLCHNIFQVMVLL